MEATSTTADFPTLRNETYSSLRTPERKGKYPFNFLGSLSQSIFPNKLRLIESHYVLMRLIDDIVDGDLDSGINAFSYIRRKKEFLKDYAKPFDNIEDTLAELRAELLAKDLAKSLQDASMSLLESWHFDLSRTYDFKKTRTIRVCTNNEIETYFENTEIKGVMKGALAILGEEIGKESLLTP